MPGPPAPGACSPGLGPPAPVVALALAVALAAVLGLYSPARPRNLVVSAVAAAVALLARRRLGGITGDVLGAAIELAQAAGLVVLVAVS